VRKGNKGETVKLMQKKLNDLVVDGLFGPKTDAKLRAYQKSKNLKADGICGPLTWGKLGYK